MCLTAILLGEGGVVAVVVLVSIRLSATLYETAVKPLLALLSPPQRIEAAALGPTLSYFGRSLDGRLDMDGDGLVDLAVGAQGAAVLLR